jgi:HTH-type transcriptional regulator / antitoxin HigA
MRAANPSTVIDRRVIDRRKYGRLLARATPVVVQTEEENERLLAEIETLMAKGEDNLTPEEDALLELLVRLVESYESRAYPEMKASPPKELIAFLLEQRGLAASALWPVLGSKGRVSEILSGKRGVSKEQAKQLGEFFHISPAAFI